MGMSRKNRKGQKRKGLTVKGNFPMIPIKRKMFFIRIGMNWTNGHSIAGKEHISMKRLNFF
jgi:hypothetical protein